MCVARLTSMYPLYWVTLSGQEYEQDATSDSRRRDPNSRTQCNSLEAMLTDLELLLFTRLFNRSRFNTYSLGDLFQFTTSHTYACHHLSFVHAQL